MLTILRSCSSLLTGSIENMKKKREESPVFLLFHEGWFVNLWVKESGSTFREEIAGVLIEQALLMRPLLLIEHTNPLYEEYSPLLRWLEVAFQVADTCVKVLDWDTSYLATHITKSRSKVSQVYFLLLGEVAAALHSLPTDFQQTTMVGT